MHWWANYWFPILTYNKDINRNGELKSLEAKQVFLKYVKYFLAAWKEEVEQINRQRLVRLSEAIALKHALLAGKGFT